jgi:hypothetical protein
MNEDMNRAEPDYTINIFSFVKHEKSYSVRQQRNL